MANLTTNSTRDRALELLGDNVEPKAVAAALGITESMVSQYLSDEEFANQVAARRYQTLIGHNSRDRKYDALEDKLIERIEKSLNMIFDPMKLASLLRIINSAERRGSSAPAALQESRPAVALVLPTFVLQKFTTQVNLNNQVVAVADPQGKQESLITIQSSRLPQLIDERSVSDATPLPQTPTGVETNQPTSQS